MAVSNRFEQIESSQGEQGLLSLSQRISELGYLDDVPDLRLALENHQSAADLGIQDQGLTAAYEEARSTIAQINAKQHRGKGRNEARRERALRISEIIDALENEVSSMRVPLYEARASLINNYMLDPDALYTQLEAVNQASDPVDAANQLLQNVRASIPQMIEGILGDFTPGSRKVETAQLMRLYSLCEGAFYHLSSESSPLTQQLAIEIRKSLQHGLVEYFDTMINNCRGNHTEELNAIYNILHVAWLTENPQIPFFFNGLVGSMIGGGWERYRKIVERSNTQASALYKKVSKAAYDSYQENASQDTLRQLLEMYDAPDGIIRIELSDLFYQNPALTELIAQQHGDKFGRGSEIEMVYALSEHFRTLDEIFGKAHVSSFDDSLEISNAVIQLSTTVSIIRRWQSLTNPEVRSGTMSSVLDTFTPPLYDPPANIDYLKVGKKGGRTVGILQHKGGEVEIDFTRIGEDQQYMISAIRMMYHAAIVHLLQQREVDQLIIGRNLAENLLSYMFPNLIDMSREQLISSKFHLRAISRKVALNSEKALDVEGDKYTYRKTRNQHLKDFGLTSLTVRHSHYDREINNFEGTEGGYGITLRLQGIPDRDFKFYIDRDDRVYMLWGGKLNPLTVHPALTKELLALAYQHIAPLRLAHNDLTGVSGSQAVDVETSDRKRPQAYLTYLPVGHKADQQYLNEQLQAHPEFTPHSIASRRARDPKNREVQIKGGSKDDARVDRPPIEVAFQSSPAT